MIEINEAEEQAIREMKSLVGRVRSKPLQVIERVDGPIVPPFEQQSHSLLMQSIDKIAQNWIAELCNIRNNTQTIERMVISQAARVKEEITKMHLLGSQAMKEAQRGADLNKHLGTELERMMRESDAISSAGGRAAAD